VTGDHGGSSPLHEVEAERVVLDALMTSPGFAADAGLTAEAYFKPAHALIHNAILSLHEDGRPTDVLSVKSRLEADGDLGRAGGWEYLHGLYSSPLAGLARSSHFENVIEKYRLRCVAEVGSRMVQLASRPAAVSADAIQRAESWLADLTATITVKGPMRWDAVVNEAFGYMESFEDDDAPRGLPTGLIDLDRLTGGLKAGQLVVIGGRPGSGKSITAGDFARHVGLQQRIGTALFSMEMSRIEVAQRIFAAQYEVMLEKLTNVRLAESDWIRLAKAQAHDASAPLWIDATPTQTIGRIRSHARRLHQTNGIGMVVVDHLGLIKSTSTRAERREREVAEISRSLKELAQELELPVIVCAQLSRETEKRNDKKPMLSDLRESGAIEQDADIVLLLHRPAYYNTDDRPGEVDIEVAKNRSGPTGVVTAAAQLHYARFLDMYSGPAPPHAVQGAA
jgi:replicative DNA helicase